MVNLSRSTFGKGEIVVNPLRALFLSLSRMPPAVMLLTIIGLAVVVTMMVTNQMTEEKQKLDEQRSLWLAPEMDPQRKGCLCG